MDIKEQAIFLKNRHPWETARFSFFKRLLSAHIPWLSLKNNCSALDVGSGDAWFAEQLMKECPGVSSMTCWDTAYSTAQLEADHPYNVVKTRHRPEGRFDLILLMDVLEHIENDHAFLRDLVSAHLNEHGFALISVPAWNRLFSEHDRFLGHFRRYSFQSIGSLADSSGLHILREGGVFHALLVPRAIGVMLQHLHKPDSSRMVGVAQWKHGPLFTALVKCLFKCDTIMSFYFARLGCHVPGLSGWVLCQKRQ